MCLLLVGNTDLVFLLCGPHMDLSPPECSTATMRRTLQTQRTNHNSSCCNGILPWFIIPRKDWQKKKESYGESMSGGGFRSGDAGPLCCFLPTRSKAEHSCRKINVETKASGSGWQHPSGDMHQTLLPSWSVSEVGLPLPFINFVSR
jgi:hypothetical protein